MLPVLLLVAAGYGVKKLMDASSDMDEAEELAGEGRDIIAKARHDFANAKSACKRALDNLAERRLETRAYQLASFAVLLEKVRNAPVEISGGVANSNLAPYKINRESLPALQASSSKAGQILAGAAGYALGGLGAGLLAAGIVAAKNAREARNDAEAFNWEAREFRAKSQLFTNMFKGVAKRARMYSKVLTALSKRMNPLLGKVASEAEKAGFSYEKMDETAKNAFLELFALAQAANAVANVPIVTENGRLTRKSKEVLTEVAESFGITLEAPANRDENE